MPSSPLGVYKPLTTHNARLYNVMQLAGFCGQDRTVSLLHCLVGQLHEHQPQLLHLPQEMESTLKAKESGFSMYTVLMDIIDILVLQFPFLVFLLKSTVSYVISNQT